MPARPRSNNAYGATERQRAEIARYTRTAEPRLRATATVELDGRRPVPELANAVEALVRG